MKIRIKPLDLLFFGDSKPSVTGEDHRASSLTFPTPSTLYGALRTVYFASHPGELAKANGPGDPTADLKITDYKILRGRDYFYPLPSDLVHDKSDDGDGDQLPLLRLISKKRCGVIASSYNGILTDEYYSVPRDGMLVEKPPESFLDEGELENYASGAAEINGSLLSSQIFSEDKIGIQIDDGLHSTRESMLYQIKQKRYDGIELVVGFEGLDVPEEGFIKLGGQGNGSCYHPIPENEEDWSENVPSVQSPGYGKLYLTTPAIFKQGWVPDFINPRTMEGDWNGHHLKLVSACVQGSGVIGGYDIKAGKQKPLRLAVPAGSVYRFALLDAPDIGKTQKAEIPSELAQQGYGLGYWIF